MIINNTHKPLHKWRKIMKLSQLLEEVTINENKNAEIKKLKREIKTAESPMGDLTTQELKAKKKKLDTLLGKDVETIKPSSRTAKSAVSK